ncbi:Tim44/TimA family putative adaptor protein [Aurantimonas marianensis]|uniref:Tim44/TimA family putative adaptor protein n=1 Tax=Aurantimonas marianensis TaxID=2920428 RepID=A0A9X2HBQ5_9HYPH|nr:Tim44/TimA family putative adaptor protein [Aurantimonas marianensis]MCP3056793.1 Tim44/TimA family putative adaptor protein [Aurantimonas marianensis]
MSFGTIFFIVLAAIVLFQLRSVLGRRTGNERPPFDPYSRREGRPGEAAPNDNVVTLPHRRLPADGEVATRPTYEAVDKVAAPGTPLNAELRRIRDADPNFEPAEFLEGAKLAYEMIVTAFADGDRKVLKNLLSNEVYQGFEQAITDREERGERMQSSFVGIDDAEIVSAEKKDREALVTVRIVAQLISAVLKPDGEIVEGDPEAVVEVKDVWTFSRDTRSRDPNWKLAGTESEED